MSSHEKTLATGTKDDENGKLKTKQASLKLDGGYVPGVGSARNWITADGSSGFKAEPGSYHLYVGHFCPYCHRCLLTLTLKGLLHVVSIDVCSFRRHEERGCEFVPEIPGCTEDTVNGKKFIGDIYDMVGIKQRSIPVLWDKKTGTIVSNESAEIIRMLNCEFNEWAKESIDLYPPSLQKEIEEFNAWIYAEINIGVYKAGFAKSQEAYDSTVTVLYNALDRLEEVFAKRRFLCGNQLTEADIRLFPTLFRFDHVYFICFKCNKRMIRDYKHLSGHVRDVYQQMGVANASNMEHCKQCYFGNLGNKIIPIGPDFDFNEPSQRSEMK